MNIILLKTKPAHLAAVVDHAKHALPSRMIRAQLGDILLIAESPPPIGDQQIRYAMRYKRTYEDTNNESSKIWGRRWRYVVQGENCCKLENPFSMEAIAVSSKNYGQGAISFVYLDEMDSAFLTGSRYLKPLL